MCHNSALENEQIEKCIKNGMPRKIVKTIIYTMRKRAAANEVINQQLEQQQLIVRNQNPQQQQTFISKCPFGYGKLSIPTTTPSTFFTIAANNKVDDVALGSSNKNNNVLCEHFSQISQLSTKVTATDNNCNVDSITNTNIITNLSGHCDDKLLFTRAKIYNDDILAKITHLTREFAYIMQQAIKRIQSSKFYTLLTETAQPTHLIVIAIITFVLLTVWPEVIDGTNAISGYHYHQSQHTRQQHEYQHQYGSEQVLKTLTSDNRPEMSVKQNSMLALIVYLGAFSTHFGAQIWMTFVSGLSLYFSLPRHVFGQCQQILFPKYFAMNATLSIAMLILFVKIFLNTWTTAKFIQLGTLALTGTIEILVRLYLAPSLLRLMHEKYKIESTIGSGKEIGSLVQGDLVECPHYQRIHKAFRRIHMTVAIGNMITMAASCLHLYYIAGQLQISIVY